MVPTFLIADHTWGKLPFHTNPLPMLSIDTIIVIHSTPLQNQVMGAKIRPYLDRIPRLFFLATILNSAGGIIHLPKAREFTHKRQSTFDLHPS